MHSLCYDTGHVVRSTIGHVQDIWNSYPSLISDAEAEWTVEEKAENLNPDADEDEGEEEEEYVCDPAIDECEEDLEQEDIEHEDLEQKS